MQRIGCIEFKHESVPISFGYDRDAGDCINWISPYLACRSRKRTDQKQQQRGNVTSRYVYMGSKI